MNQDKFLAPVSFTYKTCIELKNRALFGSVVNADVASFLKWNPQSTPYQVSKGTGHHRARVFEVYRDIEMASGGVSDDFMTERNQPAPQRREEF